MANNLADFVPIDSACLNEYVIEEQEQVNNKAAEEVKAVIDNTFMDFGVQARIKDYIVGPSVTRYNVELAQNCSVRTLTNLICDIQVRLGGLSVRYDLNSLGSFMPSLEVENPSPKTVCLKELYDGLPSRDKNPLAIPLGLKVNGDVSWIDITRSPHILISGTTGSGKSMFINSLITTLVMRDSPEELKFVLFDPKRVELHKFKELPHLLCPIINEADTAKKVLVELNNELERRYDTFFKTSCSNITEYNEDAEENGVDKYPYIIAIIDEYADLIDSDKTIINPIISLVQKARAAGIHLIIATQRPATNILTGVLKANMPTHIAFMTANVVDSMTIIGEPGAEKLLSKGDMLVQSPVVTRTGLIRLQGSYVHRAEIKRILEILKERYTAKYDIHFLIDREPDPEVVVQPRNIEDMDEERYQAIKEWVMTQDYMSISRIQRECSVGFNRAGRYFLRLQEEGIVSKETTKHGCPVYIKKED